MIPMYWQWLWLSWTDDSISMSQQLVELVVKAMCNSYRSSFRHDCREGVVSVDSTHFDGSEDLLRSWREHQSYVDDRLLRAMVRTCGNLVWADWSSYDRETQNLDHLEMLSLELHVTGLGQRDCVEEVEQGYCERSSYHLNLKKQRNISYC